MTTIRLEQDVDNVAGWIALAGARTEYKSAEDTLRQRPRIAMQQKTWAACCTRTEGHGSEGEGEVEGTRAACGEGGIQHLIALRTLKTAHSNTTARLGHER
jgi:hypothetical protein